MKESTGFGRMGTVIWPLAFVVVVIGMAAALLGLPRAAYADEVLKAASSEDADAAALAVDDVATYPGSSVALRVSRSDAMPDSYSYSCANAAIATVDSSGTVRGVKPGRTTVTVTSNIDSATGTATVTVGKASIARSGSAKASMNVSASKRLSVRKTAGNPVIIWKSSKPKVVKVDSQGNLSGKALGFATVSATAQYGNTVKWTVVVKGKTVHLKEGKSLNCAALSKYVAGYTFNKAKWKSSKKAVAKIDGKKIKALKRGKAKVTFKAGKYTYTLNLLVECKHKYRADLKYPKYCKAQAAKCDQRAAAYNSRAESAEMMMDRSYGYSYRQYVQEYFDYLAKANQEYLDSDEWLRKSQMKWYKCSKCGKRK